MPEHEPTEDASTSSDSIGQFCTDAAEFADKAFDRLSQELRNARAMGQMAVTFGTSEFKRRVRPTPASPSATSSPSPASTPSTTVDHGAIDDLIAGYDDLSASQVVGLLEDLDADGLERVADHERRGRGRRTILGRTAQLLEHTS